MARLSVACERAFTLVELLAIISILGLGLALLAPALARSQPTSKAIECQHNLRQLTIAWQQWAVDHNDTLLTCQTLSPFGPARANWMNGALDFSSSAGNWDPNVYLVTSPVWPYVGKKAGVFHCPADPARVKRSTDNQWGPRTRSYSMSEVFGNGEWLDRSFNSIQTIWRIYDKGASIVLPRKTFVFSEEHPASLNDGALAVACTGAQPGDPPSAAQIIDFFASFHHAGANLSFADGHIEGHRWLGTKMRTPFVEGASFTLNVPAEDSWMDVHWVAQNTTVKR